MDGIEVGEFVTLDYDGLEPMIREFLKARSVDARHIDAGCFGVAGAVTDQVARLTNVPWLVDAASLTEAIGLRRCRVLAGNRRCRTEQSHQGDEACHPTALSHTHQPTSLP